jgi:hypothetical protein
VRRERPHPGARLTFSDIHGYRFQTFATNTRIGQLAQMEARHRAHARVEDRIRTGKDPGYGAAENVGAFEQGDQGGMGTADLRYRRARSTSTR